MKQFIILLSTGFIFSSCFFLESSTPDNRLTIYKFRLSKDYSKNVPVQLSSDKKKIISFPGNKNDITLPISLGSGYYLQGSNGVNSAYTSIKIEDFNELIDLDSLNKLIIDKDPFEAYYVYYDNKGFFFNNNGIDTLKLKNLVESNKIEDYFEKLK